MNLKSILSYSFQSFYLAGSFLLLFIFLPTFYNLSVGISLSVIGLVILISRIFDVISDFLIGYLTEKRIISGRSRKNQILFGIIRADKTPNIANTSLTAAKRNLFFKIFF